MKNITTGADRLVQLIAERKKIEISEAAKLLGVEQNVVGEWAEFLEQEKQISINYKLSKTWLEEKQISKKDVIHASKEIISEKEAFERKITAVINSLEGETEGFEKIKTQFNKIHQKIKEEIETVKEESKELERFEFLKNNIDKDIKIQQKEFEKKLKEYRESIEKETENFAKIHDVLETEKSTITTLEKQMNEIERNREIVKQTMSLANKELEQLEHELNIKKKQFEETVKGMQNARLEIDKVDETLSNIKNKKLGGILNYVDESKKEIERKQEELLKKAKEKTENIKTRTQTGTEMYKAFESSLIKKVKIEDMMENIEKEKKLLREGLEKMKIKVRTFSVIKNNSNIKTEIKNIEKEIKEYEKRRESLRDSINKLMTFIKR